MFGGYEELVEAMFVWTLQGVLVGYVMGFLVGELNDDPSVIGDIGAGVLGALVGGFLGYNLVEGRVAFPISMAGAAFAGTVLTVLWRAVAAAHARVA